MKENKCGQCTLDVPILCPVFNRYLQKPMRPFITPSTLGVSADEQEQRVRSWLRRQRSCPLSTPLSYSPLTIFPARAVADEAVVQAVAVTFQHPWPSSA